jgi:glycosyltransferase involved in cell wall biosynthesis
MGKILLTYIVPVYNTEAYVLRCLQSIVSQGLADDEYEVLVVDDGSTDGSRAMVESFAHEHPQVRLLVQENAGVSAARNLAMDNARGQYLQFVDSDDYLVDGVMAPLLHRAVEEDLDVLLFNYRCVDTDGNELPVARDDNYPTTPLLTGPDYLANHCMTPYVWRFLLRRDYLDSEGWRFDTSLIVCEDGALIARFLLNAARVVHDDTAAYCYVNRGDSAMHNPDPEHLRRRILSQVDSASSIDKTIKRYEASSGKKAPASVAGVRNVYLYFAMTKALTCGCVNEILQRIRQAGLYPFPCVGPEANYYGSKWKIIHWLMMRPALWRMLSSVYRKIRK